jgi:fumarate reductase iron-sulfur subunit
MADTLTVRIRRSSPGESPRWDTFAVTREAKMSVLDVVTRIQREQDPTLAYRYSCRAGMCGSCAMRVNGKNRWTCRTQITDLGDAPLTLEPLPHYTVLRDLAVDMAVFFDRYRAIRPEFVPTDPKATDFARIRPDERERREIDAHVECITCGSCVGECSFVATNASYLGPAALNRAHVLLQDRRDGAGNERLARIGGHGGVWGCHTQFNCTAVCPMDISPTRAIQNLKRQKVRHAIQSVFRYGRA